MAALNISELRQKFDFCVANYPGRTAGVVFIPGGLLLALSGVNVETLSIQNAWMFSAGVLDMSGTAAMALWADPKRVSDTQVEYQDRKISFKFLRPWHYPLEYMGATQFPLAGLMAMSSAATMQPHEMAMTAGCLAAALVVQVREKVIDQHIKEKISGTFNKLADKAQSVKEWVQESPARAAVHIFWCVNAAQVAGGLYQVSKGDASGWSMAASGAWFALGNILLAKTSKRATELKPIIPQA